MTTIGLKQDLVIEDVRTRRRTKLLCGGREEQGGLWELSVSYSWTDVLNRKKKKNCGTKINPYRTVLFPENTVILFNPGTLGHQQSLFPFFLYVYDEFFCIYVSPCGWEVILDFPSPFSWDFYLNLYVPLSTYTVLVTTLGFGLDPYTKNSGTVNLSVLDKEVFGQRLSLKSDWTEGKNNYENYSITEIKNNYKSNKIIDPFYKFIPTTYFTQVRYYSIHWSEILTDILTLMNWF